jgi:hypothetical protein
MKLIISIVLVAMIGFLTYMLIININDPIKFMRKRTAGSKRLSQN